MTALLTELLAVAAVAIPGAAVVARLILWAAKIEPRTDRRR